MPSRRCRTNFDELLQPSTAPGNDPVGDAAAAPGPQYELLAMLATDDTTSPALEDAPRTEVGRNGENVKVASSLR